MTHPPNPKLDLTIRASNGSPWPTDRFHAEQTVEHVTEVAVKHFVEHKIMQPGEYELVLVIDCNAQPPLHPTDTLEQADIVNDSILALVSSEPHVDG